MFGCISAGGYDDHNGICLFNQHAGACHYGIGIGVIAFLACIAFLAIEVQFDTIDNPDTKKYITLADLGFSALWCFLWFVGFCYLADMWRKQDKGPFSTSQINNCQAAIAFSFFSIITWVSLLLLGFILKCSICRFLQFLKIFVHKIVPDTSNDAHKVLPMKAAFLYVISIYY